MVMKEKGVFMAFKEVAIKNLAFSPVKLIGDDWLVLSSGNEEAYNAMTIAWGSFGTMWNKKDYDGHLPTMTCFVRPQRYTNEFMLNNNYFSVCKLKDENKEMHNVIGVKSGRDLDKIKEVGLTPIFADNTIYYEEAELVVICKKLYTEQLKEECFNEKEIVDLCYPQKDFHYMYIGQIEKVLIREN